MSSSFTTRACGGWDDNGKFRPERVKHQDLQMFGLNFKQIWVGLISLTRGCVSQLQVSEYFSLTFKGLNVFIYF